MEMEKRRLKKWQLIVLIILGLYMIFSGINKLQKQKQGSGLFPRYTRLAAAQSCEIPEVFFHVNDSSGLYVEVN